MHKRGLEVIEKKLQSKRSNKDYWKINEHGNKKGSAKNSKYITDYYSTVGKTSERSRRVREIKRENNLKFSPQRDQDDRDEKDKRAG